MPNAVQEMRDLTSKSLSKLIPKSSQNKEVPKVAGPDDVGNKCRVGIMTVNYVRLEIDNR